MNENKLLKLVLAISGITLICFAGLIVWLQGEIEQNRNDFQKKLVEISSEIKLRPKSLPETVEDEFKNLSNTIEKSSGARIKELVDKIELENSKKLNEINEQFVEVMNQAKNKISGNEKSAQKAYELAVSEALKNPDMARVLCLNAINHAPDNYSYVEGYIKIVMSMGDKLRGDDLNQARSILEVALYQVPSDKVEGISTLLNKVADKQNAIALEDSKKAQKKLQEDLVSEYNEALDVKIEFKNNRIVNNEELRNKLEKLQELKSTISSSENQANEELLKTIDKEFIATSTALDIQMKIELIDNCLANARINMKEQDSLPAMASSLQTASSVLAQVWGIDFISVPKELQNTNKALANDIQELEKKYLKKKSEPALLKIKAIMEDEFKLIIINKKDYTSKINSANEALKKINIEFANISDIELRNECQSEPNKVIEYITQWNKDRYQAYQSWVVEKCQNTLKEFKEINLPVTSANATALFTKKGLSSIKTDLLIPEVASIYNDILQKLYIEMAWDVRADCEKLCATGKKKTLEDNLYD